MKVSDIMVIKVKSVLPDILVSQALDFLSKEKISGLPVIDKDNKLVGMFTEKDVLKYILPAYLEKVGSFVYEDNPRAIRNKVKELLKEHKVCDIMCKEVITTAPDTSLSEVARIMLTGNARRLPIVDKEKKVVGIIAREDVVKAFIKFSQEQP
ncbi:MAG: CBS domain-containing protein [Candidatus Omnitrophica bacterium]|nr:CBS domain-containing protein [Candidatus Omnitrophota bacterium]MDD5355785.1 CBS domain-containing protein [Candidatus Omnitrophota bacterium]